MKKTVMITGATSGIGLACAQIFAKNNYNLILTGRRAERLEALKTTLQKENNIEIVCLVFDVRERNKTIEMLKNIDRKLFPTIDILINNAGLASGLSTIQDGNYDNWDKMLDTNVKGLLNVSKEIIPILIAQNFGHIVNISSIAGKAVYPNGNVYCASKHAVDALSQAMRIELLPHQIKVTTVNPGATETEFSLVRFDGDSEKAGNVYKGFTPLSGADVADAIYYCCTLPAHVCINDLTITPVTQANSHYNTKK